MDVAISSGLSTTLNSLFSIPFVGMIHICRIKLITFFRAVQNVYKILYTFRDKNIFTNYLDLSYHKLSFSPHRNHGTTTALAYYYNLNYYNYDYALHYHTLRFRIILWFYFLTFIKAALSLSADVPCTCLLYTSRCV